MIVLSPIGRLYSLGMGLRNRLYDRGMLRAHSLGARTISIGNLTTGGTGKTPLVALTARILAEAGEKVCILTRGYGRPNARERVLVSDGDTVLADASAGGDEPVELAGKLAGKAVVIADADRVGAANWARERFGITAFVLDDGFQHRRAARDLDIVCVDATNPWGGGRVLPAGNLRESLTGIRRADVIVLTRANLVDSTAHIIHRLRRLGSTAPVFLASTKTTSLTALNDFLSGVPTSAAAPVSALAFAAIGNPDSLRSQLLNENFAVAGFETFRDHHHYTQQDVNAVEARARELAATSLLTTAKDAVKLAGLRFSLPVVVVGLDTELDDLKAFRSLVIGDQRGSKVR